MRWIEQHNKHTYGIMEFSFQNIISDVDPFLTLFCYGWYEVIFTRESSK